MTKKSKAIRGVLTALVTPFKNGEVDQKSFVKLIQHQLAQGISGFVINGTTGESPCLELKEVRQLFDLAASEVAGEVPLMVGTGGNSTARTCELSAQVAKWNPDALLVVVPYYNRPPQRGLFSHFKAVAAASSVPIYLYDVPSRTVASLDTETTSRLSAEINIAGLKDATGNMEGIQALKKSVKTGFTLLSGDDVSAVDFCAHGGDGVISVSSHIIGAEMREALSQASRAASDVYKNKYAELLKWLYIEANPIPVKMALYWMGVIESPELRLPLMPLDQKFHGEFKTCLTNLGKLP